MLIEIMISIRRQDKGPNNTKNVKFVAGACWRIGFYRKNKSTAFSNILFLKFGFQRQYKAKYTIVFSGYGKMGLGGGTNLNYLLSCKLNASRFEKQLILLHPKIEATRYFSFASNNF